MFPPNFDPTWSKTWIPEIEKNVLTCSDQTTGSWETAKNSGGGGIQPNTNTAIAFIA